MNRNNFTFSTSAHNFLFSRLQQHTFLSRAELRARHHHCVLVGGTLAGASTSSMFSYSPPLSEIVLGV
jgi:hypothetical protein